jgi:hypothetical protein
MKAAVRCCVGAVATALALPAAALALALPAMARAQSECPRGALPAYSHNDYENAGPLTDALSLGFVGAEADVFLVDGVLRVGHDRKAARAGGSLEALYLSPLQALAARCTRLTADGRPFFLAVELKEESAAAHDSLLALLDRHRALLESASVTNARTAAVAVVLVGWQPSAPSRSHAVDTLLGRQYRLTRSDRSDDSARALRDPRIRLVSLDYGKTIGRWWRSAAGRRRWLEALRAVKASAPDRLLRVHNVPADERIYATLLAVGVDLIGTKELAATARLLAAPAIP